MKRVILTSNLGGVIPSKNGRLVECIEEEDGPVYISLFEYAKGMLMVDNGYRYRKGAPLEEYFYNTGKALGSIHRHETRAFAVASGI